MSDTQRGTGIAAVVVALAALGVAAALGARAWRWNDELAMPSAFAGVPPSVSDPHTPRLARRVVFVLIDGLGEDESHLPYLDELRARGASTVVGVPYPTISRPQYVTLLTGVPPSESGVRTNRVRAPASDDTVMDRVRAAGLRTATAADFGSIGSLFVRGTPSIMDLDWQEHGDRIAPPAPLTWPFDDARRAGSLAELGPAITELATADDFVAVLVLDVDRAGHASGVGDDYRAAARATDAMLRTALAGLDLERDAIVITADHGHVAAGGHGGTEREVSRTPLVLAGAGIARGHTAPLARSIDVAPTLAALLGVPAPGHAEGVTLVDLLALTPVDASRRLAADHARAIHLGGVLAVQRRPQVPDRALLAWLGAGLALAGVAGFALSRRRRIAVGAASLAGITAFIAMLAAIAALLRFHGSPSYVPTLARVELRGALAAALAIAIHLVAIRAITRRARTRGRDALAAATGTALVGLALALTAVTLVRAHFPAPHVSIPDPFWLVALPALDLAAATCALAAALSIAIAGRWRLPS